MSCEKRVYPRRLSRILLLPMFHVQLTPAICARDGARELKMFCGQRRIRRQAGERRTVLQAVTKNVADRDELLLLSL